MPKITALLHTHNDALRLGRVLDSLRACDEVLVVDDNSDDETEKVVREHGAVFKTAIPGVSPGAYAVDATNDWILWLRPNESLSDTLEAALFEWKQQDPPESVGCYSIPVRRAPGNGSNGTPPEARLINRKKINWVGDLPPVELDCSVLGGDLLCFNEP